MDKFKGKYRIPSARWAIWDYGRNAAYFVTLCTAARTHDFGHIADGEMVLSSLGQAAWDCWMQIPSHFPFVELGEFVAMPNHVHGIIIIDKHDVSVETQDFASLRVGNGTVGVETQDFASLRVGNGTVGVETQDFASLPVGDGTVGVDTQDFASLPRNRFGPQSKNLASIVRGYKIGVTKFARQHDILFMWQSRYYDRIIRDGDEYKRIAQYILTNPHEWHSDSLFDGGL